MNRALRLYLSFWLCALLACGGLWALAEDGVLDADIGSGTIDIGEAALPGSTTDTVVDNGLELALDIEDQDVIELPDVDLTDISLEDIGLEDMDAVIIPEGTVPMEDSFVPNDPAGASVQLNGILYEITDTGAAVKGLAEGAVGITEITFPEQVNGKAVTSIADNAFSGCNSLTQVTIPGSVKTIGQYAFYNCDSLTRVTLQAGVEEIGYCAFHDCNILTAMTLNDGLKTVNYGAFLHSPISELLFPDTVTSLNKQALNGNSDDRLRMSLKKVRWPAGVTQIPDQQFRLFPVLEEVIIPSNITSIGSNAFEGCPRLAVVSLPQALVNLGTNAFSGCARLQTVTIPDKLRIISNDAFSNSSLQAVTVPGTVKTVGSRAFYNCDQLTMVTLNAGVEEIGSYAFAECGNLTSLTMGDGLKTVNDGAFANSPIAELLFPDSVRSLSRVSGDANSASLKRIRWPEGITTIPDNMFEGLKVLEEVILPDSVTEIGRYAFQRCESLKKIEIPAGMTGIGPYTFYESGLQTVTVPGRIKTIGDSAFNVCNSLTGVVLESGVEEIGASAFCGCEKLTSVTMASGLKTIKYHAFTCSPIEALLFPDTVTELDPKALNGTDMYGRNKLRDSLKRVRWPAGVKEIPEAQFSGFSSLQEVTIPKGVKAIGNSAFNTCGALTAVTLPSSLTGIGQSAFYQTGLKKITVPGSVKVISDSAFSNCDSLTSAVLKAGVQEIGTSAFSGCDKLTSIKMDSGLKTVKYAAFGFCPIKELLFPDTVTELDPGAFKPYDMYGRNLTRDTLKKVRWPAGVKAIPDSEFSSFTVLQEVTIPNGVKSLGNSAFSGCSALATVSLPDSLTSIGDSAFYRCFTLKEISIPGKVKSIGSSAFSGSGLQKVTVPGSVKTIGNSAFSGCGNMTSAVLKAGVVEIGGGAFSGCKRLKRVQMGKGLKKVGYSAFVGSSIEALSFPDTVTELHPAAINYNYEPDKGQYDIWGEWHPATEKDPVLTASLKEVRWPAGVKEIPGNQFLDFDKLEKVVLPDGLKKICYDAFRGCTSLREIVVNSKKLLSIDERAFSGASDVTFTVPHCKGMAKVIKYLKKQNYKVSVTRHAAIVVDPAVKPTYTKTGLTEGRHCKECGEVLEKQKTVPKLVRRPTSVKLNKKGTVTLAMGKKLTLKATVAPKDARTTLTWTSSDKKIATVSKAGVVTPVAKGTAVITVKTSNKLTASVKVKVVGPKPTGISIKQGKKATLKVGGKLSLTAVLSPAKADTRLTWTSSDKAVATVSGKGVVTAKAAGTANITVKTDNGKKAVIVITVK